MQLQTTWAGHGSISHLAFCSLWIPLDAMCGGCWLASHASRRDPNSAPCSWNVGEIEIDTAATHSTLPA